MEDPFLQISVNKHLPDEAAALTAGVGGVLVEDRKIKQISTRVVKYGLSGTSRKSQPLLRLVVVQWLIKADRRLIIFLFTAALLALEDTSKTRFKQIQIFSSWLT